MMEGTTRLSRQQNSLLVLLLLVLINITITESAPWELQQQQTSFDDIFHKTKGGVIGPLFRHDDKNFDRSQGGCFYQFQHYDEGDRIVTNEPCLNCTCHNSMLMCYLKVCPFSKPIGQHCTIEKQPDMCCPIITCPQVPVNLQVMQMASTTTLSPVSSTTGMVEHVEHGCSIEGNFYPDGAQVPGDPSNPCELCYCIRNHTACVMQECTLQVHGCNPVFEDGICCPVRYKCQYDKEEEEYLTTTMAPLGLPTTTMGPTIGGCIYQDAFFADGALIPSENPCDHCYCMKSEIVCAVQECRSPLDEAEENCTPQPPPPGQCCPDAYTCESDTTTDPTAIDEYDVTTMQVPEDKVDPEGELFTSKKPESKITTISPEEDMITEVTEDKYTTDASLSSTTTSSTTKLTSSEISTSVKPDLTPESEYTTISTEEDMVTEIIDDKIKTTTLTGESTTSATSITDTEILFPVEEPIKNTTIDATEILFPVEEPMKNTTIDAKYTPEDEEITDLFTTVSSASSLFNGTTVASTTISPTTESVTDSDISNKTTVQDTATTPIEEITDIVDEGKIDEGITVDDSDLTSSAIDLDTRTTGPEEGIMLTTPMTLTSHSSQVTDSQTTTESILTTLPTDDSEDYTAITDTVSEIPSKSTTEPTLTEEGLSTISPEGEMPPTVIPDTEEEELKETTDDTLSTDITSNATDSTTVTSTEKYEPSVTSDKNISSSTESSKTEEMTTLDAFLTDEPTEDHTRPELEASTEYPQVDTSSLPETDTATDTPAKETDEESGIDTVTDDSTLTTEYPDYTKASESTEATGVTSSTESPESEITKEPSVVLTTTQRPYTSDLTTDGVEVTTGIESVTASSVDGEITTLSESDLATIDYVTEESATPSSTEKDELEIVTEHDMSGISEGATKPELESTSEYPQVDISSVPETDTATDIPAEETDEETGIDTTTDDSSLSTEYPDDTKVSESTEATGLTNVTESSESEITTEPSLVLTTSEKPYTSDLTNAGVEVTTSDESATIPSVDVESTTLFESDVTTIDSEFVSEVTKDKSTTEATSTEEPLVGEEVTTISDIDDKEDISATSNCEQDNETYYDGDDVPANHPCDETCMCKNGVISCEQRACSSPPPAFLRCKTVEVEGSCCPTYDCEPESPQVESNKTYCLQNGIEYSHHDRVPSDDLCTDCFCYEGEVLCATQECYNPNQNCKPMPVPRGSCCPIKYTCENIPTKTTTDLPVTTTDSVDVSKPENVTTDEEIEIYVTTMSSQEVTQPETIEEEEDISKPSTTITPDVEYSTEPVTDEDSDLTTETPDESVTIEEGLLVTESTTKSTVSVTDGSILPKNDTDDSYVTPGETSTESEIYTTSATEKPSIPIVFPDTQATTKSPSITETSSHVSTTQESTTATPEIDISMIPEDLEPTFGVMTGITKLPEEEEEAVVVEEGPKDADSKGEGTTLTPIELTTIYEEETSNTSYASSTETAKPNVTTESPYEKPDTTDYDGLTTEPEDEIETSTTYAPEISSTTSSTDKFNDTKTTDGIDTDTYTTVDLDTEYSTTYTPDTSKTTTIAPPKGTTTELIDSTTIDGEEIYTTDAPEYSSTTTLSSTKLTTIESTGTKTTEESEIEDYTTEYPGADTYTTYAPESSSTTISPMHVSSEKTVDEMTEESDVYTTEGIEDSYTTYTPDILSTDATSSTKLPLDKSNETLTTEEPEIDSHTTYVPDSSSTTTASPTQVTTDKLNVSMTTDDTETTDISIDYATEESDVIDTQTTGEEGKIIDSTTVKTDDYTTIRPDLEEESEATSQCTHAGVMYNNGDEVPPTLTCQESCICANGTVECTVLPCKASPPVLRCTTVEDNQGCCPIMDCEIPEPDYEQYCSFKGEIYNHGSNVPMDSLCQDCFCIDGEIVCAQLECFAPSPNCHPVFTTNDSCCPDNYICDVPAVTETPDLSVTPESKVNITESTTEEPEEVVTITMTSVTFPSVDTDSTISTSSIPSLSLTVNETEKETNETETQQTLGTVSPASSSEDSLNATTLTPSTEEGSSTTSSPISTTTKDTSETTFDMTSETDPTFSVSVTNDTEVTISFPDSATKAPPSYNVTDYSTEADKDKTTETTLKPSLSTTEPSIISGSHVTDMDSKTSEGISSTNETTSIPDYISEEGVATISTEKPTEEEKTTPSSEILTTLSTSNISDTSSEAKPTYSTDDSIDTSKPSTQESTISSTSEEGLSTTTSSTVEEGKTTPSSEISTPLTSMNISDTSSETKPIYSTDYGTESTTPGTQETTLSSTSEDGINITTTSTEGPLEEGKTPDTQESTLSFTGEEGLSTTSVTEGPEEVKTTTPSEISTPLSTMNISDTSSETKPSYSTDDGTGYSTPSAQESTVSSTSEEGLSTTTSSPKGPVEGETTPSSEMSTPISTMNVSDTSSESKPTYSTDDGIVTSTPDTQESTTSSTNEEGLITTSSTEGPVEEGKTTPSSEISTPISTMNISDTSSESKPTYSTDDGTSTSTLGTEESTASSTSEEGLSTTSSTEGPVEEVKTTPSSEIDTPISTMNISDTSSESKPTYATDDGIVTSTLDTQETTTSSTSKDGIILTTSSTERPAEEGKTTPSSEISTPLTSMNISDTSSETKPTYSTDDGVDTSKPSTQEFTTSPSTVKSTPKPTYSTPTIYSTTSSPFPPFPGSSETTTWQPSSTTEFVLGPGACLFDGKVYVSAQQIPRDDPCDFCFCFRGDIICLQQSCPPPIPGCYEEAIHGFCCPRYECPVSYTTVNVTTTTTPFPTFPSIVHQQQTEIVKCEIGDRFYYEGEIVDEASGPCLECRCGPKRMMECDPLQCQAEPMLRKILTGR